MVYQVILDKRDSPAIVQDAGWINGDAYIDLLDWLLYMEIHRNGQHRHSNINTQGGAMGIFRISLLKVVSDHHILIWKESFTKPWLIL